MPPTPGPSAFGVAEGVLAPRSVSVRPEIGQGKALVKDESGDEEELLAGGGGGEEEELLAGDGGDLEEELLAGTQFTCFTATKVQMLTQKEELCAGSSSFAETQALASGGGGGGGGGGEGGAAAAAGIAGTQFTGFTS